MSAPEINEPDTLSYAGRLREVPGFGTAFDVEVDANGSVPRLRLRALARSFASSAGIEGFTPDTLHVGRIEERNGRHVLTAIWWADPVAHRHWGDIADTPYARSAATDGLPDVFDLPFDTVLSRYRDGDEIGWDREFDVIESEHTAKFDQITTSMQESGQHDPILLGPDGRVWDGHKRLAAARALGWRAVKVSYRLDGHPLRMPA